MKTYKGKYSVKNPAKYKGDLKNIVYRSSWERTVFNWLDTNTNIKWWVSEELVIPYICQTDRKKHRYFPDVIFETKDGKKYIVEIKPDKETKPPKPGRRTKRLITEALTYQKNISKWNAAHNFAVDNGYQLEVWTEKTMRSMGIKII
jgi:hypothetical protein